MTFFVIYTALCQLMSLHETRAHNMGFLLACSIGPYNYFLKMFWSLYYIFLTNKSFIESFLVIISYNHI
jgi:hypothetical protein